LVATGITLAVVLTRKKDTKTGPTKPDLYYGGSSKNPEHLPLTNDTEKVKTITNVLNEALKDENIHLNAKDTKILLNAVVNDENLRELKRVIKDVLFNDNFEELKNTIKKLIKKVKKNIIDNKDFTNADITYYIKTKITDDKINKELDKIFDYGVIKQMKKEMEKGLKVNVEEINNLLASQNINCKVTTEDVKTMIMAVLEPINMAFIEALVEESNFFKEYASKKQENIQIPINAIKTYVANVEDYINQNLNNNSLKEYINKVLDENLTELEKLVEKTKGGLEQFGQIVAQESSKAYTTTTKKIKAINN
jgi:hypothetical protein